MIVEPATLADLDAIDEIERLSFPQPWPRSTFESDLTRAHARLVVVGRVDDRGLPPRSAAESRRGVIDGFCNYWLVAQELHVLAIATHPARRRGGIGKLLLDHALAEARATGCTLATLEVRRGNAAAIALYERAGFATVYVRARYYQDNDEDALVMTSELSR